MAVGVPVIVSDTKIDRFYFNESLVMFFRSEDEGDLATKILALYRDTFLRTKLTNNALRFIRQNNWQVKEVVYLRIINTILGKNQFSLS
jgi:glycosyltransferase involved in cell wall biosynthesis